MTARSSMRTGGDRYDLVVIGAGSGGLVGADFAARLGARVALIEAHRIGGDCTWTGCVPSKALLKSARVAHDMRAAERYGVMAGTPTVDLARVRDHVRSAIDAVYALETPAVLRSHGIDVVEGEAVFTDPQHVRVGGRVLESRSFLICTGARPAIPPIPGLADVRYLTYEQIFDNARLPNHLVVLGAGPIGVELGFAYRRLGAAVTIVGLDVLPKEEPEVRAFVEALLTREGVRVLRAAVNAARHDGTDVVLDTAAGEVRGDLLLVATGRAANTERLGLTQAGVAFDRGSITVNRWLQTSARHIYAAGDVTGGPQFTHYAAWQAFQAVRNALLPGRSTGVSEIIPRVTFLDPEIAHVGLAEPEARARHGHDLRVLRWPIAQVDRAIADGETGGFVKVMALRNGHLVGATAIASRAGELIAELTLAMRQGLTLDDVAATIHAYPTWSTPVQQLAADDAIARFLTGVPGRLALRLAGHGR